MKKILISLAVLLLCPIAYAQDVMPSLNDIVFVTAQSESFVKCYTTTGADENLTFEAFASSTFESHGLTGMVETSVNYRQDTCSIYARVLISAIGTPMQTVAWRTDLPNGIEVQKVDVRTSLTVIGAQGQLSESVESLSPSLSFVFPNKNAGKGDQKSEFGAELTCNITDTSPSQWQALCKSQWVPCGLLILLLDGKVFCVSLPGERKIEN